MTFGILLRTGPYTSQNVDTVYHLAKRLISRGHGLKLFLYEDAVMNIDSSIQSPQERNLATMMKELADSGAEIQACGTCAKFRGLKKSEILEGTKLAGMVVFAKFALECDRFLSFGF